MMGTDHINMMFASLSERAEEDPTTDAYVIIEQLRFMGAVKKVACAKKNKKSERWLRRLEDKVRNGEVHAIVLPVYMENERHWVAIRIDFENEEIAYGESFISYLKARPLNKPHKKATRWSTKECPHQRTP